MAFGVQTLAQNSGDAVYYDPTFRTIIETYLPILQDPSISQRMSISADRVYQFEADFYGLLSDLKIPMHHFWIYLRVNGMDSPTQFGANLHNPYARNLNFEMILPNSEMIQNLAKLHRSTRN